MASITDEHELEAWLKGKSAAFACVLAARAALRVAPVLGQALQEDKEDRRRALILPASRALAAANFAGTWPRRQSEIRTAVRNAGREVGDAAAEIGNAARMNAFEAKDGIPEMQEYVWRLEGDARALGIAESAVDAVTHALQAAVDAVDAEKGIASPDAVSESCVAAAAAACRAIDGVNGYAEFLAEPEGGGAEEPPVAAHIAEFWQAVEWDARFLQSGAGRGGGPDELVAGLSLSALWPEGIPVWTGRRWADFKDELPGAEGWSDWVDWYEDRLTGRPADEAREFERVTRSSPGPQTLGEKGEVAGQNTDERRPSAIAGGASAQEEADRERRYYTDDELRSYLTAPQLKRLSSQEQVAHMVGWFSRMYEDPIQETPYDSEGKGYLYMWGGPFNARDELWEEFGDLVSDDVIQAAVSEVERDGTIEWAPTGSNPKREGGPDEEEKGSYEPVPPTLEEIHERRASGITPKFGDPDETRGRRVLQSEIASLRDAMEDEPGRHGGMGHNRPPESLSLSDEQTEEVAEAVKEIDREAAKPVPDVDAVVESTGRLRKVLGWFARKLDMAADSFAKTFGAVTGRAVGVTVVGLVAGVVLAILNWLDAVFPLF